MEECLIPKIKQGKSCNLIFHILKKGSRKPFKIDSYSVKAEYRDVFGNVISTYAYPVVQERKPIYVDYNKIKLCLAPNETMRIGFYDIFICIVIDEHVKIHSKSTVNITADEDDCCCSDDIHFDIPICEILYEDGRTYYPVINDGYLSFTLEEVPLPDPYRIIDIEVIDNHLYINGEDMGEITTIKGDKGDTGDPGVCYVWRCSRIPPRTGDTVMINHEWHVLTESDLPPAAGTVLVLDI
jgi:hypothetical protein